MGMEMKLEIYIVLYYNRYIFQCVELLLILKKKRNTIESTCTCVGRK